MPDSTAAGNMVVEDPDNQAAVPAQIAGKSQK